jgi:hypothetical protein
LDPEELLWILESYYGSWGITMDPEELLLVPRNYYGSRGVTLDGARGVTTDPGELLWILGLDM